MAFDFPASPTVGQVSNGYSYNGYGWAGGPGVSGPQTEQFFDVSGKTAQDITVPTWAKSCTIIGYVYVPASAVVMLRLSADGTTFFSGGVEYQAGGPVHNTGSAGYVTNPIGGASYATVTPTADNVGAAHNFTLDMNLTRPTTNHVFLQRVYSKAIDSAATNLMRTLHYFSYLQAAATTALSIKAVRIALSTGAAMGAGSILQVKWLGDSAAIPQSNAIADAPNDAYQYLRGQNAWNSGGTLSGDLTINRVTPYLKLSGTDTPGLVAYQKNGVSRWIVYTDNIAETGSNAGSDFRIMACNDAGTGIYTPLMINRATGVVTAIGLPPKPANGAVVGEWKALLSTAGGALVLPAGGTWAWFAFGYSGAYVIAYNMAAFVSAGGTAVIGANAGVTFIGAAWRIA